MERAFELARAGQHLHVTEIVKVLKSEGYDPDQIQGRGLQKQLQELIKVARQKPQPPN